MERKRKGTKWKGKGKEMNGNEGKEKKRGVPPDGSKQSSWVILGDRRAIFGRNPCKSGSRNKVPTRNVIKNKN